MLISPLLALGQEGFIPLARNVTLEGFLIEILKSSFPYLEKEFPPFFPVILSL